MHNLLQGNGSPPLHAQLMRILDSDQQVQRNVSVQEARRRFPNQKEKQDKKKM